MKDPIVIVKDVTKEYNMGEVTVKASDEMNFEIFEGEFVVVLGPSGSGKSTVLNMVGGMDRPTSGEVIIDGENITKYSDNELTMYRRKKVGFVFQFYNLMSNLTALENVELVRSLSDNPLNANDIMRDVGLSDRAHNFPAQLSGGEQQRVAIARALVKNPLLLLCDEPTGALDYVTGKLILKLLYDINKNSNKTIVVITHNAAIAAMADRVIKVKSGTVESITINENPESPERIEW
ncbi:ABC transporter ATP-binding protein [Clostridium chromiireducens]|uniref:ABC transporter ATP-binding protein n=1 Tax=Clostridium chromiireducens TaxID=225345 RepID=A0A1V4ISS4_9CLOT|nr:ABC transporter ATP-binding protein [Clostridium chromiireducens]MVX64705.1 ATP-binding cassette domain-containing protein [Clostridium chromiireducens]OPJ62949.1 putative ABC transporter ATP-binding protein [Clostridium chromiireducens]RII36394.1 ABC transporter ATP-binding protein [Clostridium chromiireducens]